MLILMRFSAGWSAAWLWSRARYRDSAQQHRCYLRYHWPPGLTVHSAITQYPQYPLRSSCVSWIITQWTPTNDRRGLFDLLLCYICRHPWFTDLPKTLFYSLQVIIYYYLQQETEVYEIWEFAIAQDDSAYRNIGKRADIAAGSCE